MTVTSYAPASPVHELPSPKVIPNTVLPIGDCYPQYQSLATPMPLPCIDAILRVVHTISSAYTRLVSTAHYRDIGSVPTLSQYSYNSMILAIIRRMSIPLGDHTIRPRHQALKTLLTINTLS